MAQPYVGEIRMFAGNFPPNGWMFCDGQLLPISENETLFQLIGTTYGGDGQTTFALPDFRGRVAVGTGQGPGLPTITLGEMAGEPTHTLISTEMPLHNHTLGANANFANIANPNGSTLAIGQSANGDAVSMYINQAPNNALNAQSIGLAGGSQPHNNMQPYLGMNYIICVSGIFPSRN